MVESSGLLNRRRVKSSTGGSNPPLSASKSVSNPQIDFSIAELFAALDAQRMERGLTWSGVAKALWEQSAELNARRMDHPD